MSWRFSVLYPFPLLLVSVEVTECKSDFTEAAGKDGEALHLSPDSLNPLI